jgi:hypothetical protein
MMRLLQAVRQGLLKHRHLVAISRALQAPGHHCHYFEEGFSSDDCFHFSALIILGWTSTETSSPHEQGDGERAGVVKMADWQEIFILAMFALEELHGIGCPLQYSHLCTLLGLINVDILPSG